MRGCFTQAVILVAAASAGHCLPSPPDVALEAVPRPGIYFGTTTAGSHLVQTGIAWGRAVDGADGLRHTCRHEHKLQDWGWREHNGADYGVEFIGDRELNLNLTLTWHRLGGGNGSASCVPWVLVVSGVHAAPPRKARRAQRDAAAVDAAISLFAYAATPLGHVAAHSDVTASDSAPRDIGAIVGSRGLPAQSELDAFSLLAWIERQPAASPGLRALTHLSASAAALDSEWTAAETRVGGLPPVAPELLRWHCSGARTPAEDAWRVEDLLARELRKSGAAVQRALLGGRQRARQVAADARSKVVAATTAGMAVSALQEMQAGAGAAEAAVAHLEKRLEGARVVPLLNSTGSARGNTLAVLQLVTAVPFELRVVFLQGLCVAGPVSAAAEASAAAVAAPAVPPSPMRWWEAAAARGLTGVNATQGVSEAQSRAFRDGLCARLGLCGAAAQAGEGDAGSEQRQQQVEVVASRALANLLGSVTHFSGRQVVAARYPVDDYGAALRPQPPEESAPLSLYTGVPSRSFFPRGFLWDEGYHALVASQWRPAIARRTVGSWLAAVEGDGWVAREMILGSEARSRVPEEFRTQHRDIANPPSLFMPVLALAADALCRAGRIGGGASAGDAASPPLILRAETALPTAPSPLLRAHAQSILRFCQRRMRGGGGGGGETTFVDGVAVSPTGECNSSAVVPGAAAACEAAGGVQLAPPCKYACIDADEAGTGGDEEGAAAAGAGTAAVAVAPAVAAALAAGGGGDAPSAAIPGAADGTDGGDYALAQWRLAEEAPASGGPHAEAERTLRFLLFAYPRMLRHYRWLLRTQAAAPGAEEKDDALAAAAARAGGLRWRGATRDHNFASGLDDHPRGAHPTPRDQHVDLLAWAALAAEVLADVGAAVGAPLAEVLALQADAAAFVARLRGPVHWDEGRGVFCDVGALADAPERPQQQARAPPIGQVCHVGYVSLMPLLLRHVDAADGARLHRLLDAIEDPAQLWSPHGLRSLSARDPLHGRGEDYWRGAVWLNMNFLAVAALRHYGGAAATEPAAAARCRAVSRELQAAVVQAVAREYARTGFVWESYDGGGGRGRGTHPFTGWSALVALMAAGRYPV